MKKIILTTILAAIAMSAACSGKPASTADNKTNSTTPTETKTNSSTSSTTTSTAASATVKTIYDHAMKRECAAIPPMLTEEFRKAVGTSKDELDALCDTFTDSGKLTSFEIKSEEVKGDTATVKVSQTFKDGKKEDKDERMKKSADGKWLMDS